MRKQILSLALALALCLGAAGPVLAASTGYSDVPEGHWAAGSIRRATELGIFQGVAPGRFGRGESITRAAFVAALVRLFGWEAVTPEENTFTDVTAQRWFYTAVETACANGAVVTAARAFRPTEPITREEMAAMVMRALGYTSLAGAVSTHSSPFTDVTTNRGFITLAREMGIVDGIGDGRFAPDSTATREQAAAMLVRVWDKLRARSIRVSGTGNSLLLRLATPRAQQDQQIPTTPLEPLSALYESLCKLKNSGADMDDVVLCLTGGGVRTLVSGGGLLQSEAITGEEVAQILAQEGVRTYYSARYESAYCIYPANAYQTAILWYQSEESLAAKLQLARLMGVTKYILE